jgi:hypothetical protein
MSDIKTTSRSKGGDRNDCREDCDDHEERPERPDDGCKPRNKCNNDVQKQNELLTKHKALYWRRISIQRFAPLTTLAIDTGIRQAERECLDPIIGTIPIPQDLTNIPPFTNQTGIWEISVLTPVPGITPASRVMVVPLSPISSWVQVTQPTEPYWNSKTKTVWITLANGGLTTILLNVLVWNPSYFNGPGEADPYNIFYDSRNPFNQDFPQ